MDKKRLLKWFEKFGRKRILENIAEKETRSHHTEPEKEKEKCGLEKIIESTKTALWNANEFFYKHFWISAVAFEAGLIAEYCRNPEFFSMQGNTATTFWEKYNPVAYLKQSEHSLGAIPFYAGYLQRAFTGAIKYAAGLKEEFDAQGRKSLLKQADTIKEFTSKNPNLFGDFCGALMFSALSAFALPYYYVLSKQGIELDLSRIFTGNGFSAFVVGVGAFLLSIKPNFKSASLLRERENMSIMLAKKYPWKNYEECIKALAFDLKHGEEIDVDKLQLITEVDYNDAIDCLEQKLESRSSGDDFFRFVDNCATMPLLEIPKSEREFRQLKGKHFEDKPIYPVLPLVRTAFMHLFLENYGRAIKSWERILKECRTMQEHSEILCLAARSIELSKNPKHKEWAKQKWIELAEEYKTNRKFYNESEQRFQGSANVVYVAGEKLLKSTIVIKQASGEQGNARILDEYNNLKYFSECIEGKVPRVIDLFELDGKNHLVLEHKGRNFQDTLNQKNPSKEETEEMFSETIRILAKIHHHGRIGQNIGKIKLEKQRKTAWYYEKRIETIFFDNLGNLMKNQQSAESRELFNQGKNRLLSYYRPLAREIAGTPLDFYYKDANLRNWIKNNSGIVAVDFERTTRMPPQFDLASLLEFEPRLSSDQITHFCLLYLKNIRKEDYSINCTEKKFLQDYQLCRTQRHLELAGYRIRDVARDEVGYSEIIFHVDSAILSFEHLLKEKNFGAYEKYHLKKFTEGLMGIRDMIYSTPST